ncbi:KpsF/GutQ family sugar-phosphate isomerase [Rhizobium leguminosarum bv. viciae]|nr:KpsF/GutQ family sugar-phosphate isomerase [Rhizobium leguminosarum bv. viciae]
MSFHRPESYHGIRKAVVDAITTAQHGLSSLIEDVATSSLGEQVEHAAHLILIAGGRLIVVGVGKSGHIARKLAATFASTGTPAYFVHPTEASHGDLGMIQPDDVVLAVSWSGETVELAAIIAHVQRFNVPLIGITCGRNSLLARMATVTLLLPKINEACPHGLAPTTSSVLQLAVGDALAIAILRYRGFTADDFRILHPGGQLGHQLKTIGEMMRGCERLPLVDESCTILQAVIQMAAIGSGMIGIVDDEGSLVGVIAGDEIGRHLNEVAIVRPVTTIMNPDPFFISPELSRPKALELMNDSRAKVAFVAENRKPLGLIRIEDLNQSFLR